MKNFITVVFTCLSIASFGQIELLKDLNHPDANSPTGSSAPWRYFQNGNKLFFVAYDPVAGDALYVTDGATTVKVVDTDGDVSSTAGWNFATAGSKTVFLRGTDAGQSIWVTDGTPAGTTKLKDQIDFNRTGNIIGSIHDVVFYFIMPEQNVTEIWKTDGTVEGTSMVMNIGSGRVNFWQTPDGNGEVQNATDDYLFFATSINFQTLYLWKTDGTEVGTTKVVPNAFTDIRAPRVENNEFYFQAGPQMWKTDGTEPQLLLRTFSGPEIIDFIDFSRSVSLNDKMFGVLTTTNEDFTEYHSDYFTWDVAGTSESAIVDINPNGGAADDILSNSTPPVLFKGAAWFIANDGTNGYALWKSDGTPGGTTRVTGMGLPDLYARSVYASNDHIWVTYGGNSAGSPLQVEMWASDGTNAFSKIFKTSPFNSRLVFQDDLYFSGNDNIHDYEVYRSDGTSSGTGIFADINTTDALVPLFLLNTDDKLLFSMRSQSGGINIGESDGTAAGTAIVKELPEWVPAVNVYAATIGTKVLFTGADADHGNEPWISNGTLAGTLMLADTQPGSVTTYTNLAGYTRAGNKGFFFSQTGELWVTDGTQAGTTALHQFDNPTQDNYYNTAFQGSFYFFYKENLWKSDGTPAGTVIVKQVRDSDSPLRTGIVAGTTKLYFMADDFVHGMSLWVSDGTTDGTNIVKEIHTGSDYFFVFIVAVVDDIAYFGMSADSNDDLWRSDGTPEGTYRLKDINESGPSGVRPLNYLPGLTTAMIGNEFYFMADDGTHGSELWKSDGTEAGTVMVKDATVGEKGTSIVSATTEGLNNKLFFMLDDGVHGAELWRSNGTAEGTFMVEDLNPGEAHGAMTAATYNLAVHDGKVFFIGVDPAHGSEIYWHDPSFVFDQTITFDPIDDKKSTDTPFELTASSSSGLPITFSITSGPATVSGNTLTITGGGTVVVKATQAGNDDYSSASAEQSFDVELILGLEDEVTALTVWPNPATNVLNVPVSAISMIDMLGREVVQFNNKQSIDVGHLPRGMYIVKLQNSNQSITTRKIILR